MKRDVQSKREASLTGFSLRSLSPVWRGWGLVCVVFVVMIAGGCGDGSVGLSPDANPSPLAANSASLSWNQPTTDQDGAVLTDLAGYKIYYGQATPLTVTASVSAVVYDPNQTSYVVSDLNQGTYFFTVTAFDSAGNESAMSDEVSKTIQ